MYSSSGFIFHFWNKSLHIKSKPKAFILPLVLINLIRVLSNLYHSYLIEFILSVHSPTAINQKILKTVCVQENKLKLEPLNKTKWQINCKMTKYFLFPKLGTMQRFAVDTKTSLYIFSFKMSFCTSHYHGSYWLFRHDFYMSDSIPFTVSSVFLTLTRHTLENLNLWLMLIQSVTQPHSDQHWRWLLQWKQQLPSGQIMDHMSDTNPYSISAD